LMICPAMGEPIMPSPIKPIFMINVPLVSMRYVNYVAAKIFINRV
jgi:hypothetical protein